jgi:hypothetical protein
MLHTSKSAVNDHNILLVRARNALETQHMELVALKAHYINLTQEQDGLISRLERDNLQKHDVRANSLKLGLSLLCS